ncbi:MAG: carbohydrate binding domain-containing protein [Candidatus Omnitrophica bacterium]|nr:carbohydrate binding domain-containing protein [Candidatus Omnitrophota bacterium]
MKKIIFSFIIALSLFTVINKVSAEEVKQFDKYGGWMGLKGEKKGYFHTQNINDRWWIITPEGNVFWSIGMYCVRMGGIPETGSGRRVYQEVCLKKYGNEQEWAKATRMQLYKWGFNTIGDWSAESIYREPGFSYVIGINLPSKSENVIPKGNYGYFPDVFSKDFADSAREQMQGLFNSQPYLIDDPQLLGYFLADEPAWYGSKGRRGSLADDFIALDGSKPGKIAWIELLKFKYSEIKKLNAAWQTNYSSFEELLNINKIKDTPVIEKDKLIFFREIAEEFAKILYLTLREFDKYHMALGTRPSRLYPEVVAAMGKYCDIFSTSGYNLNQGYQTDPKLDETIDEIYKYTQKPIMLGVIISAQDAGLPHGIVRTQRDRGISYWRYLAKIARHPAIVGVHWFEYFDPPLKCYDAGVANWGLVSEKDEPYTEAANLIAQANKMVYAYALGLSNFAPEFDGLFGITKKQTEQTEDKPLKKVAIPLADPGFENGKASWEFQTWKGKSKASLDYFVKHSGKSSLKIQGGPDEGWGSVGVGVQGSTGFTLKPGYQYKLSVWVKAKDVENSAFLRIKVTYKSGGDEYFGTEEVFGTKDWQKISVDFSPREENTVGYLGAQLVGKGTAWFDDVTLELME